MKKKIVILSLSLLCMIIGSCGTTKDKEMVSKDIVVQKDYNLKEYVSKENEAKDKEDEQVPIDLYEITIYYTNEEVTDIKSSKAMVRNINSEDILVELEKKGVIPATVKAFRCDMIEKDEKHLLELDLSKDFIDYLNEQGTTGEIATMVGVCNTFLEAYKCDGIKITVMGETLVSSHAEYPGYLEKFESLR